MALHQKSSADGPEHERKSNTPDTLAAEAASARENPPDQHPKPTNELASKTAVPQPDSLPTGWESRLADNGRVYFVDHNRRTTTWLDPSKTYPPQPDNLPKGWEISWADNGRTYFVDHNTRITTWEDPRSTDAHAREAPVPKPEDLPSGRGKDLARNGGTMLEGPSLPNRPTTSLPLRAKL